MICLDLGGCDERTLLLYLEGMAGWLAWHFFRITNRRETKIAGNALKRRCFLVWVKGWMNVCV